MIDVRGTMVTMRFPEVHPEARCSIVFQKTLRIPDDNRRYPVPPGLGRFPLTRIGEFPDAVPGEWQTGSGIFFPMYQGEAALIIFIGYYPFAVKVLAGDTNVLTGRSGGDKRLWRPQDYAVIPQKPWIDWLRLGSNGRHQCVAAPLSGDSGTERGALPADSPTRIRVTAHPMRAERYREYRRKRAELAGMTAELAAIGGESAPAAGWLMHRECLESEFGRGAWELSCCSEFSAYPVNSRSYRKITGKEPTGRPPTASDYVEAGLPWFEHYREDCPAAHSTVACCF